MAHFIRHADWIDHVAYTLFFEWPDGRGAGYSFDCDEHGNVDTSKLAPAGLDSFTKCRANSFDKPILPGRIERREYTEKVYAIIQCTACEAELELTDCMTNRCGCGAFYNGSGQRLAHPSQWGEETGERFDANGNQIGFVDDSDGFD